MDKPEGPIDPYRCLKCEKFETHDYDEMMEHVDQCGVVQFKGKQKTMHEKISEVIGSTNHLTFWYTETGSLCYCFGEGMTEAQLALLNKVIDIITHDTIQSALQMNSKKET